MMGVGNASVCGAGWPEYAALHNRIISGGEGRFLAFKPDPWRGYANQLLGISSAFAVALLTDKAFLIDDGEDGAYTRLYHSPHIRWDALEAARGAREGGGGGGEEEEWDSPRPGVFVWDDLKDCESEHPLAQTADSWDLSEMLGSFSYVEIGTNTLWWPYIFRNPRYHEVISSWGMRSSDDFFSCAMSYLLRPTPALEEALAPLRSRMARVRHTIGIQLRLNRETVRERAPKPPTFSAPPPQIFLRHLQSFLLGAAAGRPLESFHTAILPVLFVWGAPSVLV